MKKITFSLVLAAVLLLAASSCVRVGKRIGKGKDMTKTLKAGYYNQLDISSLGDVYYTQGDKSSITLRGDSAEMANLDIAIVGSCLKITEKRGTRLNLAARRRVVDVYLTSPDLIGATVRGAGDFAIEGAFDTDTLRLTLLGMGDIQMDNVVCDAANIELKGTGDINIGALTAQWADIELRGTGDIDVKFLNTGDVRCTLRGVGDVNLSGNVKTLHKDIQGTGDIDTSSLKLGQ